MLIIKLIFYEIIYQILFCLLKFNFYIFLKINYKYINAINFYFFFKKKGKFYLLENNRFFVKIN